MNLVCPTCGAPVQFTDTRCPRCGESLEEAASSTLHMRVDPELLRRRHDYATTNLTLNPEQAVCLKIRGLTERVIFGEQTEVILGRVELNQSGDGFLDLTRYGALQRGVSRSHARMQYIGGKLMLADLGSVNGTWLNERKLDPNQPVEVHNGDELLLGHLPVKVMFEDMPRPRPAEESRKSSETLVLPTAQKLPDEKGAGSPNSSAPTNPDAKPDPSP